MQIRRFLPTLIGTMLLTSIAAAGEQQAEQTQPQSEQKTRYLRVRRDAQEQPIALETAITRFRGTNDAGKAVFVDLVGAVHVGDKQYYKKLNDRFEAYDAVLYELVAAKDARVAPGERPAGNPVSFLQTAMKDVLKLEFQLDLVDYTASNMVHADMSPEEFSQSMKQRGESFFKMFLKAMGEAMAMQSQNSRAPSDLEMLVALLAKDRAYRLKRIMAEQFENMEGQLSAINGPDGSTIITERNKKALKVLGEQLELGREKLAIFYGAGHFSDMAERLENDFGFQQQKQQWLKAWTIAPEETSSSE